MDVGGDMPPRTVYMQRIAAVISYRVLDYLIFA
jgi:hypothetical protein